MTNFNFLNNREETFEDEIEEIPKIKDGKYIIFYSRKELNCTCFNPPKVIKYHVHYQMLQKEGVGVYYYPTGEIEIKAFFKKDKKTGTWKFYNKDGTISETIDFENDLKQGHYKKYENEKLIKHFIYDKNTINQIIKGDLNESN